MRKYKFGFDIRAAILFLIIMLPNFIWFAIPAPSDVLRIESRTPILDMAGAIFQVLFVVCLCILLRKESTPVKRSPILSGAVICIVLYYACWLLYYKGMPDVWVLLGLTVFPCAAFMFFALARRNWIAGTFIVAFTACHLGYTLVNFVI